MISNEAVKEKLQQQQFDRNKSSFAVITGGGYGIGRATSLLLAADGWRVAILDTDIERAKETEQAICSQNGLAYSYRVDVTDSASIDSAIRSIADQGIPIRALVNCAAMRYTGTVLEISEAQWDRTIDVVLKGSFLCCKAIVPYLQSAGGGSIVNISSPDAAGRRGMLAYSAAKAAVETMTMSLAADHISDHIRVNAVVPGFTYTGMTEQYPPERLEAVRLNSVAGRLCEPEDVARLIRFLVSSDGETFTGGLFGGIPPVR